MALSNTSDWGSALTASPPRLFVTHCPLLDVSVQKAPGLRTPEDLKARERKTRSPDEEPAKPREDLPPLLLNLLEPLSLDDE